MSEPLPRELYTVDDMRRIDRAALDALGISASELMRRAASDALRSLRRHWPQARRLRVHCG
ncbi:MAG: bifunctional ADP-dependent NAD(P)H-hydrate dehydratase/NAD(P)H-hydrate epimerase, partial [Rhodanobacter sp.]